MARDLIFFSICECSQKWNRGLLEYRTKNTFSSLELCIQITSYVPGTFVVTTTYTSECLDVCTFISQWSIDEEVNTGLTTVVNSSHQNLIGDTEEIVACEMLDNV